MSAVPTIRHTGTTVISHAIIYPAPAWDEVTGNVTGVGAYVVEGGSTLDFLHSVSPTQTIRLEGSLPPVALVLEDPMAFHGHVIMDYAMPTGYMLKSPPGTEKISVSMQMISHAVDSWSFRNDVLRLWFQNRVVDTLNLTVHDPYGITVQAGSGGWLMVSANDRTSRGIDTNHGHPTPMPTHP